MQYDELNKNISYRPVSGSLKLYHGSKSGLKGAPRPDYARARRGCDFGRGFYLGTKPEQAKTLICNSERPIFYEASVDMTNLNCVTLDGMAWALTIAYNRQRFQREDAPGLYDAIAGIAENCDVIIGPIADDRMGFVLQDFFELNITDQVLLKCMSGMNLGSQYALKTQRACNRVDIVSEHALTPDELEELTSAALENQEKGGKLVTETRSLYRNIGKTFDQILREEAIEREINLTPNPFV